MNALLQAEPSSNGNIPTPYNLSWFWCKGAWILKVLAAVTSSHIPQPNPSKLLLILEQFKVLGRKRLQSYPQIYL